MASYHHTPSVFNNRHRTGSMSGMPVDVAGDATASATKRRSSSRNIKRPKFDDELVESSLGGGSSGGGAGIQSSLLQQVPSKFRARNTSVFVPESPIYSTPTLTIAQDVRKRLASKAQSNVNKRSSSRKGKNVSNIQTKDLGRWKPSDDLTLILGVQQTCDLITVHRGVKFSCKFTLGEIEERWYALLYDPTVSRVAQQAMKNLHLEQISTIQAKALYSKAEEELLCSIKSNSDPSLDTFGTLLQNHPDVFFSARTAKALQSHWEQMKQYYLLQDQNPTGGTQQRPAALAGKDFSEVEEQLVDHELLEPPDEALNRELAASSRQSLRETRLLEDKVAHLSVLVDTVTGISPPDFDTNTLAVLRGRLVRYLMRSDHITLGRKAAGVNVDVDLTLEGPAWKISRRQGIISLCDNGEFVLQNEGKRPVYVDGQPVLCGGRCRLLNNAVLEIAGLKFIFLINAGLVNKRTLEREAGESKAARTGGEV